MTYTLTTPLYYVNDRAHLGSTYTTIACDALARHRRLRGDDVLFITGCDEHGLKIQRTAEASGRTPQSHCDLISDGYRQLWQRWGISHDRFIRTTDPRHRAIVEQFFARVEANGDIRQGRQQGWYCVACEEFKDEPHEHEDPECEIHRRPLEWRDEMNLFFRLSRYQQPIAELIQRPDFVQPPSRRREVENFVASGLKDFSISRLDLPWGIAVPGYSGHTFYVWFDALLGYLTALLEPGDPAELEIALQRGWPAALHVIGKDILRFHAVFWPAMLMSAGLPLPDSVFGHGFLTREGQKMGKSLGNVLDPVQLLDRCGRDAVRWYLLREIPFGEDGDFQQLRFCELVNNDLSNTIGNLLNRTAAMAGRWFGGIVPSAGSAASADHPLATSCLATASSFDAAMERLEFRQAAESLVQLAETANCYLSVAAPWKRFKLEGASPAVAADLYAVLETCRWLALLLTPLVPDLASRMLAQLSCAALVSDRRVDPQAWATARRWGGLVEGASLPEPTPVMQRLELDTPL